MDKLKDRIYGSMIGGAIGDALGYPVEFDSFKAIQFHFGERGITRLQPNHPWHEEEGKKGKAVFSDDTYELLRRSVNTLRHTVIVHAEEAPRHDGLDTLNGINLIVVQVT